MKLPLARSLPLPLPLSHRWTPNMAIELFTLTCRQRRQWHSTPLWVHWAEPKTAAGMRISNNRAHISCTFRYSLFPFGAGPPLTSPSPSYIFYFISMCGFSGVCLIGGWRIMTTWHSWWKYLGATWRLHAPPTLHPHSTPPSVLITPLYGRQYTHIFLAGCVCVCVCLMVEGGRGGKLKVSCESCGKSPTLGKRCLPQPLCCSLSHKLAHTGINAHTHSVHCGNKPVSWEQGVQPLCIIGRRLELALSHAWNELFVPCANYTSRQVWSTLQLSRSDAGGGVAREAKVRAGGPTSLTFAKMLQLFMGVVRWMCTKVWAWGDMWGLNRHPPRSLSIQRSELHLRHLHLNAF